MNVLILCMGVLANGCNAPIVLHSFDTAKDCTVALKSMKLTGIKSGESVVALCVAGKP